MRSSREKKAWLWINCNIYRSVFLFFPSANLASSETGNNQNLTGYKTDSYLFCSLLWWYTIWTSSCHWNPHTVDMWWSRRKLESTWYSLRAWISVNGLYWHWSQRKPWKGVESAYKVEKKRRKWSNSGDSYKRSWSDRKERRHQKTAWFVISSYNESLSIPGLSRSIYFHNEKTEQLYRKRSSNESLRGLVKEASC